MGGQIHYYGHLGQPTFKDPSFKRYLFQMERKGALVNYPVSSIDDLDVSQPEVARGVRLLQSWQANGFRPDWSTADWGGAVMRYRGDNGTTATLTDDSSLARLIAAGATLYQRIYGVNQIAPGGFIRDWPAFDSTRLYGLNPQSHYWLETAPRPDTNRVTGLPNGIRIGAGTVLAPGFTYVELHDVPAFDFLGGLAAARKGVSFEGRDGPLASGATADIQTASIGGQTRQAIFMHPPFGAQVGGEAFVDYSVPLAGRANLTFSVGVSDNAECTDGVTFRVLVDGGELWRQHALRTGWKTGAVDLSAYAGKTISIRLVTNPGPARNPNCDWAYFSELSLNPADRAPVSVPLSFTPGVGVVGFSGNGTFQEGAAGSGTVSGTAIPGRFLLFHAQGSPVSAGTSLASVPFQTWYGAHGELVRSGSFLQSGSISRISSGGVAKDKALLAHPPNGGRTVLSWHLRLPDSDPLLLTWSAGILDGSLSDDGIEFSVHVNGTPYWRLLTKANAWSPGAIELAPWRGQNVLLQLVADSGENYVFDHGFWTDLSLSSSRTACRYSIPASAAAEAGGNTATLPVTTGGSCPWTAASSVPWLSVISTGSGLGSGVVSYAVAPNPGAARTGTITVAGQSLTVTQAGVASMHLR